MIGATIKGFIINNKIEIIIAKNRKMIVIISETISKLLEGVSSKLRKIWDAFNCRN